MQIIYSIAISIIVSIVIIYILRCTPLCLLQRRTPVQIARDDYVWNVAGGYKNSTESAKLLKDVNESIMRFLRYLKAKYRIDETDDQEALNGPNSQSAKLRDKVGMVLANYNPESIAENDPVKSGGTSYTVDKGKKMYICTRSKNDPNKLTDRDTLLFVILHEISHIANFNGWGHGQDFWETFAFILHEAEISGIYSPVNYAATPVNYCGMVVNHNPLFDRSIAKIWN
jgi:hypothetical protein